MSKLKATRITSAGSNLLLNAVSGDAQIQFTRIAFGNGSYADNENYVARTALKSEKQSVDINSMTVKSKTSICLTSVLMNDELTEGYKISEIGLFAKNTSEANPTEILYAICVAEEGYADFLPAYNGYAPVRVIQDFYIDVADSSATTIAVNDRAVVTMDIFKSAMATLNNNRIQDKRQISEDDEVNKELYPSLYYLLQYYYTHSELDDLFTESNEAIEDTLKSYVTKTIYDGDMGGIAAQFSKMLHFESIDKSGVISSALSDIVAANINTGLYLYTCSDAYVTLFVFNYDNRKETQLMINTANAVKVRSGYFDDTGTEVTWGEWTTIGG